MALLVAESFRGIATADTQLRYTNHSVASKNYTVSSSGPRWSTGSWAIPVSTVSKQSFFVPSPVVWPLYVEAGIYRNPGAGAIAALFDFLGWNGPDPTDGYAVNYGMLNIYPNGHIMLERKTGASTTDVLAISTKPIKGGWHFVQISFNLEAVTHEAHGQVQVYVDNQLLIDYDGILAYNPQQGSYVYDPFDSLHLMLIQRDANIATSYYTMFTDLVICDSSGADHTGFQGDVDIETLRPDGAGNYSAWTPSAGSNYQNVDETTPDGDTTYNSTSTTNNRDSYSMSSLSRATGTVKAVLVNLVTRSPEGNHDQVKTFLRTGGVDLDSSGKSAGQFSFIHRRYAFNTDADGSAWTIAKVNAMEVGVQRT